MSFILEITRCLSHHHGVVGDEQTILIVSTTIGGYVTSQSLLTCDGRCLTDSQCTAVIYSEQLTTSMCFKHLFTTFLFCADKIINYYLFYDSVILEYYNVGRMEVGHFRESTVGLVRSKQGPVYVSKIGKIVITGAGTIVAVPLGTNKKPQLFSGTAGVKRARLSLTRTAI